MKKLIWKLRYAAHIRRRSGAPLSLCWEQAQIAVNEGCFDVDVWNPKDAALEEMSYWTD